MPVSIRGAGLLVPSQWQILGYVARLAKGTRRSRCQCLSLLLGSLSHHLLNMLGPEEKSWSRHRSKQEHPREVKPLRMPSRLFCQPPGTGASLYQPPRPRPAAPSQDSCTPAVTLTHFLSLLIIWVSFLVIFNWRGLFWATRPFGPGIAT